MYDIYHWEAHPNGSSPNGNYVQPNTLEQRIKHYEDYVALYDITIPGLVDDGNTSVSNQWSARWTSIFVVGMDGKIVIRDDFPGVSPEDAWVIPAYDELDKKLAELLPDDTEPPVVTVTKPASGDLLEAGDNFSIEWEAIDDGGVISSRAIHYTTDGSSWTLIDSADGNTGSYVWTVPGDASENCKIKVNAYDPFENQGSGESDEFEIGATGIIANKNLSNDRVSVVSKNGVVFLTIQDKIDYTLNIFTSTGKCVITENGNSGVNHNLSSLLPSGHYVVKLTTPIKNYMKSIIINK